MVGFDYSTGLSFLEDIVEIDNELAAVYGSLYFSINENPNCGFGNALQLKKWRIERVACYSGRKKFSIAAFDCEEHGMCFIMDSVGFHIQ